MNWFDRAERRNGPQADFIRLKIIIRDLYATLTIWEEDDRTLNQNYENFIFRVIETFHWKMAYCSMTAYQQKTIGVR